MMTAKTLPFLSIGLRKVLMHQSGTRDIAAHAGPSPPSVPLRVPTLPQPDNFWTFLSNSSLIVLLLNAIIGIMKTKIIASMVVMVATSKQPLITIKKITTLPCSRKTIPTLQVLLVTTPTTASTISRKPPMSQ